MKKRLLAILSLTLFIAACSESSLDDTKPINPQPQPQEEFATENHALENGKYNGKDMMFKGEISHDTEGLIDKNVYFDLTQSPSQDGTVMLWMHAVRFSKRMPVKMEIRLGQLTFKMNAGKMAFDIAQCVPQMKLDGDEYVDVEKYTLSDIRGELNGVDFAISFTRGGKGKIQYTGKLLKPIK